MRIRLIERNIVFLQETLTQKSVAAFRHSALRGNTQKQ